MSRFLSLHKCKKNKSDYIIFYDFFAFFESAYTEKVR